MNSHIHRCVAPAAVIKTPFSIFSMFVYIFRIQNDLCHRREKRNCCLLTIELSQWYSHSFCSAFKYLNRKSKLNATKLMKSKWKSLFFFSLIRLRSASVLIQLVWWFSCKMRNFPFLIRNVNKTVDKNVLCFLRYFGIPVSVSA